MAWSGGPFNGPRYARPPHASLGSVGSLAERPHVQACPRAVHRWRAGSSLIYAHHVSVFALCNGESIVSSLAHYRSIDTSVLVDGGSNRSRRAFCSLSPSMNSPNDARTRNGHLSVALHLEASLTHTTGHTPTDTNGCWLTSAASSVFIGHQSGQAICQ